MKAEYSPPTLRAFGAVEELTQTGDFDPADGSVFQIATLDKTYRRFKPKKRPRPKRLY